MPRAPPVMRAVLTSAPVMKTPRWHREKIRFADCHIAASSASCQYSKQVSVVLGGTMHKYILAALFTAAAGNIFAADTAQLTDADLARRMHMPPGFEMRIFARGLSGARFMTVGPDGMIYVSLMGAGAIARLRPDGNTARPERGVEGDRKSVVEGK